VGIKEGNVAKQKMVKEPTTHTINIPAGKPTGYACNGCGNVVPAPVDKCPKCGDDEAPVFRRLE